MISPLTQATPARERRPTVFISYHHTSADLAARLIDDLGQAGHASWIDTEAIKGGDEWIKAIVTGLNNSYALVVIVTTAALQSHWVRKEILFALQKKKLIIPLLAEDLAAADDYFLLLDCQGVACFNCAYENAVARLLSALPRPLTTTTTPTARTLETDYLDRLNLRQIIHNDKYTPLGGVTQQQRRAAEMPAVFELFSFRAQDEPKRFEDAVAEINRLKRAVLLGEPGAGKTTTLFKLAADLDQRARQDAAAPLPLLIQLKKWIDPAQTLRDFIAAELGDLGGRLDELLQTRRAALLLDGLNELPAAQHAAKYAEVKRFLATHQHPALLAVVSCRVLDYDQVELGFDRLNITPLDPPRIRQFVTGYLPNAGETLFWRLAGGAEVRATWDAWQKAGASFELFWTAADIPKENPNVYGGTTGEQDRVWREKVRGQHTLLELARNPYMLLMLTSVYAEEGDLPDNRGELFALFVRTLLQREKVSAEEQTLLTGGLARVAYEMQIRRAQNASGNAQTVLPLAEAKTILADRLLYLAGSASLLNLGEQVAFSHQLLQEYFAAHFMDAERRAGRLRAADLWPPARWWERTNWEEAAILLAGLYSDDCTPIVEWLADAQPEIAAQCIVRSGAALAEATRARLRERWLPRLTAVQREPHAHARAAIGRALGQTGLDKRRGVGVRDGLPDLEWKEIPAGEFQYGLANDASAAKPQKLTLPRYFISRYPVTYAQYQCFVDDGGYGDARWWQGLAANDSHRQPAEQSFKFGNHPRDTVNWFEASAFCRWLTWRLAELDKAWREEVRLPTEFEWEKAARGVDGRVYPYGNDYDAAKGNVANSIGQTTAVGVYPQGASPYGVEEMSGNVWEWCLSAYDKPQLEARKENLTTNDRRVLRGGSWIGSVDVARSVCRDFGLPGDRDGLTGFRVVVVRPPS
ncbi:MAG: SUMF1/EgtB/PvdO family nonheme iron enzyme [Acidobacteria bacterium]|nr:SUMF1/EgtB/PvdO family nonheme iron enzyme [Acidobacteriota bacterium]